MDGDLIALFFGLLQLAIIVFVVVALYRIMRAVDRIDRRIAKATRIELADDPWTGAETPEHDGPPPS